MMALVRLTETLIGLDSAGLTNPGQQDPRENSSRCEAHDDDPSHPKLGFEHSYPSRGSIGGRWIRRQPLAVRGESPALHLTRISRAGP